MDKVLLKMNKAELVEKVQEHKKKLAQMRFDKATGKLINTASMKREKKELARVLTRYSQIENG